jgi:hypothetical protein
VKPPGVGKTLTAEAIAELLHKPLYVVSMGELGVTPDMLEERMLDILDLVRVGDSPPLLSPTLMLCHRVTHTHTHTHTHEHTHTNKASSRATGHSMGVPRFDR